MKKRMTNHMARIKHSTVRHNDRDGINGTHIDDDRSKQNRYWNRYDGAYSGTTKKEHSTFIYTERKVYEELFSEHMKERNAAAKRTRHTERIIDAQKMLKMPKSMPQETIWQIGSTRDRTLDISTTWRIWQAFAKWHEKKYSNIVMMDYALHADEQYPHIHARQTYWYTDKDGIKRPGQEKALEQMGVPLPDPDKPKNRFNNRKMTYTKECTEKLREIAKEHGIDISEVPLEQKHNLQKADAAVQELRKEYKELAKKMHYAKEFERVYSKSMEDLEEELEREFEKSKNRSLEIER